MPRDDQTPRLTIRWGRRSRIAAISIALAFVAACGASGDSPTTPVVPVVPVVPTPTTPVGSYTLQTVNGKTPPVAVIVLAPYMVEITNATFELAATGSYTSVLTSRQTVPGNISTFVDSAAGTWVQSGSNITLTSVVDGATTTGTATWDKGLLTLTGATGTTTSTYVYYQKR
jgi:hypothetical protein